MSTTLCDDARAQQLLVHPFSKPRMLGSWLAESVMYSSSGLLNRVFL